MVDVSRLRSPHRPAPALPAASLHRRFSSPPHRSPSPPPRRCRTQCQLRAAGQYANRLNIMVDEPGDHPKDVEHPTNANISPLASSTPTAVSTPVSSPDMSVLLSLVAGVSDNDEIDWSSTGIPCKPEDLPKGVPFGLDSDDECARKFAEYIREVQEIEGFDDDECDFGIESARNFAEYTRQVKESEGFDVEIFGAYGEFQPVPHFKEDKVMYDMVKEMALQALQTLNDDSGKEYELVDVEKVVFTVYLEFYLTIKAKQVQAKDEEEKMIQAIVLQTFKDKYPIELCRLKSDKLKK